MTLVHSILTNRLLILVELDKYLLILIVYDFFVALIRPFSNSTPSACGNNQEQPVKNCEIIKEGMKILLKSCYPLAFSSSSKNNFANLAIKLLGIVVHFSLLQNIEKTTFNNG